MAQSNYDRLLASVSSSYYEREKARLQWPLLKERPMGQEYQADPDSVPARLSPVSTEGQPLKTGFAKFAIPKKPYTDYYS